MDTTTLNRLQSKAVGVQAHVDSNGLLHGCIHIVLQLAYKEKDQVHPRCHAQLVQKAVKCIVHSITKPDSAPCPTCAVLRA